MAAHIKSLTATALLSPSSGCATSYDSWGIGIGKYGLSYGEEKTYEGITMSGSWSKVAVGGFVKEGKNHITWNDANIAIADAKTEIYYSVRGTKGGTSHIPGAGGTTGVEWDINDYAVDTVKSSLMIDTRAPHSCTPKITGGLINGYASPRGSVSAHFTFHDEGCAGDGTLEKTFPSGSGSGVVNPMFDKLNNLESSQCKATWSVDNIRPTCRISSDDPTKIPWTRGTVVINSWGSDGQSGFSNGSSVTATWEDQPVQLSCRDKVGNTSVINVNGGARIDLSAPSCGSINVPRPASGYVNSAIPVSVECWDGRSGCTQGSYTQNISYGSGQITISDNVGNTSSCGVSYDFWDSTGPSVNIAFTAPHSDNSASKYTKDSKIHVIITSSDNAAGVNRVCYTLNKADSRGETCVGGNRAEFDITNEGITNITAWAFYNAQTYNGGYQYAGGNRSNNADGSYSVISSIEIYYGITKNPNDVWGNLQDYCDKGVIRPVNSLWCNYKDEYNNNIHTKGTKERDNNVLSDPVKYYGTPKLDALNILSSYNSNPTSKTYTSTLTMPDSYALNDEIYVHIRACDNAHSGYDRNPDDDIIAILPPDIYPPTNPSTDPDAPTTTPSNPQGGTGSQIIPPEKIPE